MNTPVYRNMFAGFPPLYRTTLRYYMSTYQDMATGIMGTYCFRANGIYDPDLTGVGHQPLGRDIFAEVYTRSLVIGSRCTVKAVISDTTGVVGPVTVGLMLHDGDSPMATLSDTLIEQGRSVYAVVSANALSAQSVVKPLVLEYKAKEWFGVKDVLDNIDRIGATIGSNPNSLCQFVIFHQGKNTGENLGAVWYNVLLEYDVVFAEPSEVGQN